MKIAKLVSKQNHSIELQAPILCLVAKKAEARKQLVQLLENQWLCLLNFTFSVLITKILTNNPWTKESSKHKIEGRMEQSNIETSIARFHQYKASFYLFSPFAFPVY